MPDLFDHFTPNPEPETFRPAEAPTVAPSPHNHPHVDAVLVPDNVLTRSWEWTTNRIIGVAVGILFTGFAIYFVMQYKGYMKGTSNDVGQQ